MGSILATSVRIGTYQLKNRIVLPPLTRMRADANLVPTELNKEYYRQRATAGLIITEGSQISQQGQGYPFTPGIYTHEQVEGWKKVTEEVHQNDGLIFLQLWHVGRISHSLYQPNHNLPVAPSAIAAQGEVILPDFSRTAFEVPHVLSVEEIKGIVEDYRKASINAKDAGFDGVEIHAANGYLIEQFLRTVSNQRTDEYGGSIENRAKLLFEILDAVLTVWDSDKVGIRLSPIGTANIVAEPEPFPLYDHIIKNLEEYQLAYLHLITSIVSASGIQKTNADMVVQIDHSLIKHYRKLYRYPIIATGDFDKQKAEEAIEKGYADAIGFGRHFISTPDLPYRLINGIEPNAYDRSTFYGGGSKGYTDYPTIR